VEEDLDISMAISRASWLIGKDPAKGRQGEARMPCKKKYPDLVRIVCTK
jgi:hypothetical protein